MKITRQKAKELLERSNREVILDITNNTMNVHRPRQRISIGNGKEIVDLAKSIEYQDNDFFGNLVLTGIESNTLYNMMFAQAIPI